MKNKIVLFILLFFAGITLLFYFLNMELKTGNYQPQQKISEIEKNFNRINEDLNKKLEHTAVLNMIIVDTLSNQYHLSDLVSQSPALIFRYSEMNCNSCYETELFSLKNAFPKEERQIAILSSYRDKRDFMMFKKANKIELPFYRMPQDSFDWALEDYGSPYYFVLHPDLTVSHIYVPSTVLPELNREYLESVKTFLSD